VGVVTPGEREIRRRGGSVPLEAPGTDELWHARRHLQSLIREH